MYVALQHLRVSLAEKSKKGGYRGTTVACVGRESLTSACRTGLEPYATLQPPPSPIGTVVVY